MKRINEKKREPFKVHSKHEIRMFKRGMEAGFVMARYRGTVMQKQHPVQRCPYEDGTRPHEVWIAGFRAGVHEGDKVRDHIKYSYHRGLEMINAGGPKYFQNP